MTHLGPLLPAERASASLTVASALSQATVIPQLGVAWFIPTDVVPVLLASHAMTLTRPDWLARERVGGPPQPTSRADTAS